MSVTYLSVPSELLKALSGGRYQKELRSLAFWQTYSIKSVNSRSLFLYFSLSLSFSSLLSLLLPPFFSPTSSLTSLISPQSFPSIPPFTLFFPSLLYIPLFQFCPPSPSLFSFRPLSFPLFLLSPFLPSFFLLFLTCLQIHCLPINLPTSPLIMASWSLRQTINHCSLGLKEDQTLLFPLFLISLPHLAATRRWQGKTRVPTEEYNISDSESLRLFCLGRHPEELGIRHDFFKVQCICDP